MLTQPPSRSRYKMVQLLQNSLLFHFPVTGPFLLLQGNHLALQFLLVQAMACYKFFISPKLELLLSLLLPPRKISKTKDMGGCFCCCFISTSQLLPTYSQ